MPANANPNPRMMRRTSSGGSDGKSMGDAVQEHRQKVGKFHAKQLREEDKEVRAAALSKHQSLLTVSQMIAIGVISAVLFLSAYGYHVYQSVNPSTELW
eukprot:CAMPEP_0170597998 /NCGR_PEP_ID=MMETSP0224-20130122/16008_1 /TAXON_ID=285029 /ORGANISM="Togula jolla, Strain CCCM 725" /LENGTH=98 /DNA_ID=CAMNT_0010922511 /DNA_START=82 /DNA_END=378 /DNA_ORIENTATION=+